jgi:hypothetical protein
MVSEPKTTTRTRPRKGMVSLSLLVGSVFWAMSGAGRSALLDAPEEVHPATEEIAKTSAGRGDAGKGKVAAEPADVSDCQAAETDCRP